MRFLEVISASSGVRMLGVGLRRFGPPSVVALSLAMALYCLGLLVAPLHFHSAQIFFAFETIGLEDLARAWRSRVLSLWAARWLADAYPLLPQFATSLPGLGWQTIAIAQWLALWFLGIAAVCIAAYRERALFQILGTYACVVFGYSVGPDLRIYPWDMPALAVFALVVALVHRERSPHWILLAIWIGMGFKETAAVLSLFPLALDLSWRRRLLWAGATLLGCALVKVGIDVATQNSAVGFTMAFDSFYDEGPLWWWNLRELGEGYPLAINGGTLLAFLLLPNANRTLVTFKLIALTFFAGNFLFGVITEYRVWFEMIPLALYGLEWSLLRPGASDAEARTLG